MRTLVLVGSSYFTKFNSTSYNVDPKNFEMKYNLSVVIFIEEYYF